MRDPGPLLDASTSFYWLMLLIKSRARCAGSLLATSPTKSSLKVGKSKLGSNADGVNLD